jgi:hypothetical protein
MKRIITIAGLVFCATIAKSQGCSDAGFCTINTFKPSIGETQSSPFKNQCRIGVSGGSADHDITVFGSKGLTLNANVFLNYKINDKSALEFNAGSPLVARDVRPEGLTRSFVATIQYQLSF